MAAFEELYADYIEYVPNSAIESIDLDTKTVTTEMDEFKFEDASFYPRVRGAKIIETMGFAKDAKDMLEGHINPITYEVIGEKDIFIAGDARPMGFSKSGNTSNSEGKYVASVITGRKLTTYRFTLDAIRIGSVKNWISISGNTI